jgi:hypothetical protein
MRDRSLNGKGIGRGRQKYSERYLPHCHFVHQKSHAPPWDWTSASVVRWKASDYPQELRQRRSEMFRSTRKTNKFCNYLHKLLRWFRWASSKISKRFFKIVFSQAAMPCSLLGTYEGIQKKLLLALYGKSNFRREVSEKIICTLMMETVSSSKTVVTDYKVL